MTWEIPFKLINTWWNFTYLFYWNHQTISVVNASFPISSRPQLFHPVCFVLIVLIKVRLRCRLSPNWCKVFFFFFFPPEFFHASPISHSIYIFFKTARKKNGWQRFFFPPPSKRGRKITPKEVNTFNKWIANKREMGNLKNFRETQFKPKRRGLKIKKKRGMEKRKKKERIRDGDTGVKSLLKIFCENILEICPRFSLHCSLDETKKKKKKERKKTN